MKSVMISIKPKYCELIVNRNKTIEVRKTKPKCDLPFRCYIYCTQDKKEAFICRGDDDMPFIGGNGLVIGEFICDRIIPIDLDCVAPFDRDLDLYIDKQCQMDREQMWKYTHGRCAIGWHISALKIYDKPRELSEFGLKRPPQSWCYVEVEE